MKRTLVWWLLAGLALAGCSDAPRVGEASDGSAVVPTLQRIQPAGRVLEIDGRPVDLEPLGGSLVAVLDNRGILLLDADAWRVAGELRLKAGTSQIGLAWDPAAKRLFASTAGSEIAVAKLEGAGLSLDEPIALPSAPVGGASYPTGLAWDPSGKLYACLSRSNALAEIDAESRKLLRTLPVGVAPFDVLLVPGAGEALVACWADAPVEGRRRADSSGTEVEVDERGIGVGGVLCRVDLRSFRVVGKLPLPRQPSEIALSPDGKRAFVANANDDTVSEIDLKAWRLVRHHEIHPRGGFPFGTAPTSLAVAPDASVLYVASGGMNAIAAYDLRAKRVRGWIPAGWYPSCVRMLGNRLLAASAKGYGSRGEPDAQGGRSVYSFTGTLNLVDLPDARTLATLTRAALDNARVASVVRAGQRSRGGASPKPVPSRLGDPSPIQHVFYVIKENRTYDQVFGDLPQGDGDRRLCMFPREVTPNHHALAEEFVLLDNFYCNGVNSADGHAWTTEGNATAYFERTFGGWTRSYPFGDDPLATSRSGYIWDNVLDHGLSFRNFGEFAYTEPAGKESFVQILADWRAGTNGVRYRQKIGVARVARYSVWDYPGWNMGIPDVLRADVFIRELRRAEAAGEEWPSFTTIYLPQDHTSGASPGMPTPRAHMADNDLALGRVVEAISKSRYWPRSAIFVIEDDPQNGVDHIDGHRSLCLVISPYARRGVTISEFYNQTSVLHTIERILGLPPMNMMDAMAPIMDACFQSKPDLRPYSALPVSVPLDELNPPASSLTGERRRLALLSARQNWRVPDAVQDRSVNRATWSAVYPDRRYPSEWEGPHGKGLRSRGLALTPDQDDD